MKDTKCKHFIEGKRIYLREVQLSDVNDNYYRWMNDPEVTRYLESRFSENSMRNLIDYVNSKINDRDNVFLAIVIREDNRHIGNIKIGPINWIHRFADLGIMIGEKDFWGKGFATEAIRLVTDYAFRTLNLQSLTAGAYAPNRASIKSFLKAGWQQEGVRKGQYFYEGSYVDGVLLGISIDSFGLTEKRIALE